MFQGYDYSKMFKPEEILDYLRKSQSDDPLMTVEEVLAKHERILDEWDERYLDGKVPEENRYREVVSGETIKERPEINKVLRLIENPKYKAVKVVEPQRLTRGDLEDIGRLMKLLKLTNTYVITPERMYDLRDEYDWNAFETELKRGNDYLKYTKKILLRGRLLSVSQGNYLGSTPPYGFDKTYVMDGKRKCPTLKENPEQANIVRMIFDMYGNKGMGRSSICYYLDELGVKAPKGDHWEPTAVKEMLRNVHYIGKTKWNWRKTMEIVEDGEIKKTRLHNDVAECLVYEGRHEGIISQDLFDKVQERTGSNHRATTRVKLRNPFASIMFCRECGKVVILKLGKNKNNPRLMCSKQSRCETGSCSFEEVRDRVIEILEQCIEDFEIRINSDTGDSLKLHNKLIKNLEQKMKDLQAKELSQWELQSHPDITKRMPQEIFQQLNEKLLHEKEEVQQALCKAKETMPEPIDYEERMARFKDALEALKDPKADVVLQNELLKACIDRIEYYREKPERISLKGKGYFPMTEPKWTNPPIELDIKLKV